MPRKTVSNTVADPTLPKIPLTIAGKTYHLVFDFNALARAEQLSGLNLLSALRLENLSAGQIRALLFAAMMKLQPLTTLEEAGNLIRPDTAGKITEAVLKAFDDSSAEPETTSPNAEAPEFS